MPVTDIEIARMGFRVAVGDAELSREIGARYRFFIPTQPPRLTIEVEVRPGLRPDMPGGVVVETLEDPSVHRVTRSDFECVLDLRSGKVSARVVRSLFAFDAMLRIALTLVLAREGGFLLHSAGLVRNGRAFLFFGVSGAGKTTVARRGGESLILSDDVVAVRRDGEGFRAYGTPFWGEMAQPGEMASAPVAALLGLGRPPGPTLQSLGLAEGVPRLLRCVLFFGGSRQEVDALLATCLELARSVPCHQLRLHLDDPLWEQLKELE